MAELTLLKQAFAYKAWSDLRLLAAIDSVNPGATADLRFICQQLNHMLIVQDLFRARLRGEESPHGDTNSETVPSLNELKSRLSASNTWFETFVAALDPESSASEMRFTFVDGRRGAMTSLEVLFHIVHHGAYHRGSIARALDLAGTPHPADSFTIFLHETEANRRQ